MCVVKPRFERNSGFITSSVHCVEHPTKYGRSPINDTASVIASIHHAMVLGRRRLKAAVDMPEVDYARVLKNVLEETKFQKKEGKDETTGVDEE